MPPNFFPCLLDIDHLQNYFTGTLLRKCAIKYYPIYIRCILYKIHFNLANENNAVNCIYLNYMTPIDTNLGSVSHRIWTQIQTRDYFLYKQQLTTTQTTPTIARHFYC